MSRSQRFPQQREFRDAEWSAICEAVTTLVANLPPQIRLANGAGEPGTHPTIDKRQIRINGEEPHAGSTFTLPRKHTPSDYEERMDDDYRRRNPFGFNWSTTPGATGDSSVPLDRMLRRQLLPSYWCGPRSHTLVWSDGDPRLRD